MANSVFKHLDDDGNLSIFASGDAVVLSCEHGHHWILDATAYSADTVKLALESVLSVDQSEVMLSAL